MINTIFLMGYLGDDPKTGTFGDGGTYANMSLAVKRDYKNTNGEEITDWFDIVAFHSVAVFCSKYLHKGSKILVEGRLQNDKYLKDGLTVYKNKIVASRIEFCDSKKIEEKTVIDNKTTIEKEPLIEGFMEISDIVDNTTSVESEEEPETIEETMNRLWGI